MNAKMITKIQFIIAVVLYGTIGMFLRFTTLPSAFVAMCRGLIGSTFIILYMKVKKIPFDWDPIKKNLFWLILSGMFLGLNWIFLFAAYDTTTVAIASLCNYTAPMIVLIVSPIVLKEKLEKKKLPFVFLAFLGIILVSGVLEGQKGNFLGITLGLIAALCFVGIVLSNKMMHDISVYEKAIIQLLTSSVTILPYVIFHDLKTPLIINTQSILIVLIVGIIHTGLAYCFYFNGLTTLSVQSVVILGYLEPVVSVLTSFFILHENISLLGWVGTILILSSVLTDIESKEG